MNKLLFSDLFSYDAKRFLEERKLRSEAEQIIQRLKSVQVLQIDRDVIFIKDCLKDLGKGLSCSQFNELLKEYRTSTIN